RERFPRELLTDEVRQAIADLRGELLSGKAPEMTSVEEIVRRRLAVLERPSLRPVINASGVILHTNLGRAPLGAFSPVPGYSNLEYDLAAGRRGRRDVHIADLIERLLGKPGIAVNNNAAGVYLVLNELAAGREVIVSRGELIEIGEGFRIPDIMARAGAVLREGGTTNKTHLDDYRRAVDDNTALILTVHHSNFRITGFTEKPTLEELAALAAEYDIPVYEDLGSGCVADLRPYGVEEPRPQESLAAGVNLVSFSGDKLLGGPQAGIIAGDDELIHRVRRNPMFRALRLDKLIYQALEETLRRHLLEQYDSIPALRMIRMPAGEIKKRADALLGRLPEGAASVEEGRSLIGGGSTPEQSIPTWLVVIRTGGVAEIDRRLRTGEPPVVARIEKDRLVVDLRTVFPEEEPALVRALQEALSR
ncbi:MAG TPA: L-seryl-tRNA(Sec) selenium transferase, partial [Bryobacterales bacterium]|nr:L-seryl-tRNA(Sec) selenium transferase [Bryobacterales bacterium]